MCLPACVFNKAIISKTPFTYLATEAFRVPTAVHRFDYSTNDEIATFSTTWCEKNMKIMFTIFSAIELIEVK